MAIVRLFIGLVMVFVLVGFSVANMANVSLNFYAYKTPPIPLFVVLFLSILLGVVVAWGMAVGEQLRLKGEVKKRDRQLKELEREIKSYEEKLASIRALEGVTEAEQEKDEGESPE